MLSRPSPVGWFVLLPLIACAPGADETASSSPSTALPASSSPPPVSGPWLVDATDAVGLVSTHRSGADGDFHFPEINGAGAALFDLEGDGDLDLFLVQSGTIHADGRLEPASGELWRNELRETGELRFVDISAGALPPATTYGMGVAVGDLDADGHPDLYLAGYGPDQLLRNRGDGTFEDFTRAAGIDAGIARRWSIAAAFADLDADGWLDLVVGGYTTFDPRSARPCRTSFGGDDYCGPLAFSPEPESVYRHRGDPSEQSAESGPVFEEVTASAGVGAEIGNTMGVRIFDFDGDGRLDVYWARDQMPNALWSNRSEPGTISFENVALLAGAAMNRDGAVEASMGVDAGDVDGDGDLDLFVTHLRGETNTLYLDEGGSFRDGTFRFGLAAPSTDRTGFGVGFLDLDHDGWLDLFVTNGSVTAREDLLRVGDPWPYHERDQVFRNRDGGGFEPLAEALAGPAFEHSGVGRGAAFGDLDEDGDTDIVVTENGGPARVLLSTASERGRWLGLRLVDRRGRDALGASVVVELSDGRTLHRQAHSEGSYASASDPRILVGLGPAAKQGAAPSVRSVVVHWVAAPAERFDAPALGRYQRLVQGEGEVIR